MPAAPAVRLHGMRELLGAIAKADRDTRLGVRQVMIRTAQPVATDAEQLARQEISRIGESWPRMRVGLTRKLLYVAPRERGKASRGDARRRRPNLATLMMDRAMEPALEQHRPGFEAAVDHALDEMAARFNRGGPVL